MDIVACSFDADTRNSTIVRLHTSKYKYRRVKPYYVQRFRTRIKGDHFMVQLLRLIPTKFFHFTVEVKPDGVLFIYAKGVTKFIKVTEDNTWMQQVEAMFIND